MNTHYYIQGEHGDMTDRHDADPTLIIKPDLEGSVSVTTAGFTCTFSREDVLRMFACLEKAACGCSCCCQ